MVRYNSQSGSAIIYVFVGIILFAALMYTYSRTSQTTAPNMDKKKAHLIASEMLGYANAVEKTVNKRLVEGCSENEINFDNDKEAGYTNPSAPAAGKCDIFTDGGLQYIYPPQGAGANYTAAAQPGWLNYAFGGNMAIQDLGTTSPELIIWTITNKEVCDEINTALEQTTADETFADGIIGTKFIGSFGTAGPGIIGDDAYAPEIASGCFARPAYAGMYIFYTVLITR